MKNNLRVNPAFDESNGQILHTNKAYANQLTRLIMVPLTRRRLLTLSTGPMAISIAGCLGRNNSIDDQSGATATQDFSEFEQHPVPAESCDVENFQRFPVMFDEEYLWLERGGENDDPGFELITQTPEVAFGDTVRFELINVTDERLNLGPPAYYNIQQHTTDGWREIRGLDADESLSFPDGPAFVIEPSEGYSWEFIVTQEGFDGSHQEGRFQTCPHLEPGFYRFVYWAIVGSDIALATVVEVTD